MADARIAACAHLECIPLPSRVPAMTSADQGEFSMSEPRKVTIGRRQLLRAGMIGFVATAASAVEVDTAAADTETDSEKRKARYQANSPEVQEFYRVNRYPKR